MPIYEYRRPDGSTFEVMQKMTEEPLTHDPDTGVPVERVFHPVAVHFKGKGFYNTDYGKGSGKKAEGASSESSSSDAGSGDSGGSSDSGSGSPSDAKPASEAKPSTKAES